MSYASNTKSRCFLDPHLKDIYCKYLFSCAQPMCILNSQPTYCSEQENNQNQKNQTKPTKNHPKTQKQNKTKTHKAKQNKKNEVQLYFHLEIWVK